MNPLRAHRKAARLTQDELGLLLGYPDRGPIGAYERGSRELTLHSALGYSLLFNVPIGELMPELVAEVRATLEARIRTRFESLAPEWYLHKSKMDVLRQLFARIQLPPTSP